MSKSLLIAAAVLSFSCSITSSSYANPAINITAAIANKLVPTVQGGKGDLGTQGGQNDPAQMFQQIMQQLTQQRAAGAEGSDRVPSRPALKTR